MQLNSSGAIPFDQWMHDCLYHPQWGYYLKGAQRVGRNGDFFTSVSVGKCFGMLLAHRLAKFAQHSANKANFSLIELGANTGQLACDILDTLRESFPNIYQQTTYTIAEHLPKMQETQRQTLTEHLSKIEWITSLDSLSTPKPFGAILSNELIDAFPVKLITRKDNCWEELLVEQKNDAFTLNPHPIDSPELLTFIKSLPELPQGYTTEYRPSIKQFTQKCATALDQGLILTIDYGYTRSDYYASERKAGTFYTFHNHKASEQPLKLLGKQDITAHVDFSQLASAMIESNFTPSYFDTQARYLTQHAEDWFHSIENSSTPPPFKLIRQFQMLTHPTMMGTQFSVLECIKNAPPEAEVLSKLEL